MTTSAGDGAHRSGARGEVAVTAVDAERGRTPRRPRARSRSSRGTARAFARPCGRFRVDGEGTGETLAHSIAVSVYDQVGAEFFTVLVDRFYDAVEHDEVLRPLYPESLEPSRAHLRGFLIQYWGGPGTYSEERGHPRLRLRHAPFAIGRAERDAWWTHMAGSGAHDGHNARRSRPRCWSTSIRPRRR